MTTSVQANVAALKQKRKPNVGNTGRVKSIF